MESRSLPVVLAGFVGLLGIGSLTGCFGATTGVVDGTSPPSNGSSDAGGDVDGGGAEIPAATTTCPAPPVRNNFEAGLDPSWVVTDESAFRLDPDKPLAGAKSLRIAYRQKASYITIPEPHVCALRLAFILRADAMLLQTGSETIARITAGPSAWFHLLLNGKQLSLAQEINMGGAAGMGSGMPAGEIAADVPVAVVATVDLRTHTTSLVVAPVGQPLPEPVPRPMRVDEGNPSNPGPITAVDLGAAPGVMSSGVGILWLDDLVVE